MKSANTHNDGSHEQHPSDVSEWIGTWRFLFFALGLVGLFALFYAEENWRGERAWMAYQREQSARGEKFESAAFIPPRVPDEENFAMTPSLAPLFGFVPGTQHWADTNAPGVFQSRFATYEAAARLVKSPTTSRVNSWVRAHTDLGAWELAFLQGTNDHPREQERLLATRFTPREAALGVLSGLSDQNQVLEELRNASLRPHSRFNLRYEEPNPAVILLPHLSRIKQFCMLLQLRASAELALSNTDDALRDLKLIFYLTDSSREEPILISHLVRMADFQLALQPLAEGMGQWSEPQLRALEDGIQKFDFCVDVRRTLEAERVVFGDGLINYIRNSPNKLRLLDELDGMGENQGGFGPMGPLIVSAPGGWLYLEQLNYDREFDTHLLPLIDLGNRRISPGAVREADASIARLTEASPARRFLHHQLFSALLLPAISRVSQKTAFAQTAADIASLACALERFRLAQGRFPDSLSELTPQFIARLPHDLITGKPLIYHLAPDGHYFLYSVGWNETDDGGVARQNKKGDTDQKEGDWVWADRF